MHKGAWTFHPRRCEKTASSILSIHVNTVFWLATQDRLYPVREPETRGSEAFQCQTQHVAKHRGSDGHRQSDLRLADRPHHEGLIRNALGSDSRTLSPMA